jgi:hypothetical protein
MDSNVWVLSLLIVGICFWDNNNPKKVELRKQKAEFNKPWIINDIPKKQWKDEEWLAKMIMSEICDSTEIEGLYLVGATAINRSIKDNCTITETINKPKQYSGVNNENYMWWKAEPTSVHKRIAIDLIKNGVDKKLNNIFAFCNLNQIKNQKIKNWFLQFKIYKKIKNVTFFELEKIK